MPDNELPMGGQEGSITRVLRISPEQGELFRRNRSRIFIAPEGESILDAILFQNQRPIELFIDVAHRAIAAAGLMDNYGEIKPIYGASVSQMGSNHLVTGGWLQNEAGDVFDLVVAVETDYEQSFQPNSVERIDANTESLGENENPLIMSVDASSLTYASNYGNADYQDGGDGSGYATGTTTGDAADDDVQPGAVGRVKDPNDGRLKENRDTGTHVDDGRSTGNAGAMAGTQATGQGDDDQVPGGQGRVKDPANDGRLKGNREPAAARQSTRNPGERGRVKSPFDGRLRGNRAPAADPRK